MNNPIGVSGLPPDFYPLEPVGKLPCEVDSHFLRIFRAEMARQIAALDTAKRVRVEEACKALDLPEEATFGVLATTCDLIDFEQQGRHEVLTTAQRYEALAVVRELAGALTEAMEALPFEEMVALNIAYRQVQRKLPDFERLQIEHSTTPKSLSFQVLTLAANEVLEQRANDEGKGGRRKVLDNYSRFVQSLADQVKELGFPIGRGGKFERLCTVIFDVAGVRATPEGAIRNLSRRKKL